jgi:hypothetical protein
VRPGLCLAAAALACACGGSNPGKGNKALYVKAIALSDGTTDGSMLGVEVRKGSASNGVLADAVVKIVGDTTGEQTLAWDPTVWGNFRDGSYKKDRLTWDSGWKISVVDAFDSLEAYLVAPGQTIVTAPEPGSTFNRANSYSFVLRWRDDREQKAEVVNIDYLHSTAANASLSSDTGVQNVDPTNMVASDPEQVNVRRGNKVTLAGGTAGSFFSATTVGSMQFRVE